MIEAELRSTKRWELTAEGEEIAREGSHECRVLRSVPSEGLAQSELMVAPLPTHCVVPLLPGPREVGRGKGTWGSLPTHTLHPSPLQRLPSGKVGFSKAMSNKWIRVDKSAADGPRVFRVVSAGTPSEGMRQWRGAGLVPGAQCLSSVAGGHGGR